MTKSDMTPAQARAAAALLEGMTARQAADRAGVTERTVRRWLAEPGFQAHLRSHQAQVLNVVTVRILALSVQALDVLAQCLDSEQEHTKRLAAADILRLAARFVEYQDILPRIEQLEERLKVNQ